VVAIAEAMLAAGLAFLFALGLYYAYLIRAPRRVDGATERPSADGGDLPHVLVQLPVFNEPVVVERALRAAASLDWPRERLTIQLLDDSTDRTTAIAEAVAAELRQGGTDVQVVRRADRSGFKAGALEAGLSLSSAPFAAVFDADFVPPADWLRRAMAPLIADGRVAFVQTRIEWGNGDVNWLTRAQRLMQDAHFAVEQDGRYRRGVPFQFNGTGGIWRRAAVEDAGGWSHDTLSEDLDLVLRVHLKGWRGVFLMEPHVVGELPAGLADFRAQQSRWSKGFVQVARKLLGPIWRSGWSLQAKLATTAQFAIQVAFPVMAITLIALFIAASRPTGLDPSFRTALWAFLATALAVLVGMTWGAYRRLGRGGVARYMVTTASVPAVLVYLAVGNAVAIVAAGFGRRTEFNRTPKTGA